jgi:hypothetical protein
MIVVVVINNEDLLTTIIMVLEILVLIMGLDQTTTDLDQTLDHEIIIVRLKEIILAQVLLKHN